MEKDKDQVFDQPREASDFEFGNEVVNVFDDMVGRSVPFYGEIQRMIAEIGKDFAAPGSNLYDLGCSTGASMLLLDKTVQDGVKFIGLDDSEEMLEKCRDKFHEHNIGHDFELNYADLNQGVKIENASLVNLCLTLQFIRPLNREQLVRQIYDGMNENGCLVLTEKVLGEDSLFNRLFIKYYYDMKRRHNYSDMEIAQKREALENVLIPYKLEENKALLKKCGFRLVDVFFKWYNFCGILAVK
jgi:tRNA (cmo5U34)-methyltransferase